MAAMFPNAKSCLFIVISIFSVSAFFRAYSTWRMKGGMTQSNFASTEERIFFVETSGKDTLNFRQSCSVESAARQNPDRPIEVFIASRSINFSSPTLKLFQELPNVKILELDLDDFFKGTPMESWYRKAEWRTSPHSVTHMANYVRVLEAQKNGGLYLDTDFIVQRSLKGLRNFVIIEVLKNTDLNNAVFHFDQDHPILSKLIDYHSEHYIPQSWLGNGHVVFNKVIKANCQIKGNRAEGPDCGPGVNLLGPETFHPIPFQNWGFFFTNRTSDELPKELTEAYAVHFWNKLSSNATVFVGSSQYYALLAAKYCPLTYAAASHAF